MPELVITRPASPPAGPGVKIVSEIGLEWTFPFEPVGFSASGLAAKWATIDRPGKSSIVDFQGAAQPTLSGSWTLAYGDDRSIEADLRTLRGIAGANARVRFDAYGPSHGGWWHVTDFGFDPIDSDASHNITVAACTIEVTAASDVVVNVGPVTGAAKATPVGKKPKEVVAAAGDTFQTLALRYLGAASAWRTIADANGITDPRGRPRVGERLKLP